MIDHKTITSDKPEAFDKLVASFVNKNKIIEKHYSFAVAQFKVESSPINIPGYQQPQQQVQIQLQPIYSCFIVFENTEQTNGIDNLRHLKIDE